MENCKDWLKNQNVVFCAKEGSEGLKCPVCEKKCFIHRYKDYVCIDCLIDESFEMVRKSINELPEIETEGGKLVSCNKLYILDKLGLKVE